MSKIFLVSVAIPVVYTGLGVFAGVHIAKTFLEGIQTEGGSLTDTLLVKFVANKRKATKTPPFRFSMATEVYKLNLLNWRTA